MAEKYWLPEGQKVESSYPPKAAAMWPFVFSHENREGGGMKQDMYLKKNSDFQRVYQRGRSLANRTLVMYVLPTGKEFPSRIGMSVSKKVGNSVIRHRVKRLIRESHRLNRYKIASGFDIVVIARNEAKNRDYRDIEKAFLHLAAMHHLIEKESQ